MVSVVTAPKTSGRFEWQRWPQTEAIVDRLIERGLEGNAFAAELARRMIGETSTNFKVWVDHIVVEGSAELAKSLVAAGYEREVAPYALGVPVYAHRGGAFPRIAIVSSEGGNGDLHGLRNVRDLAIKVESVVAFLPGSRPGAGDLGLSAGPVPERRGAGRANAARGTGAAGVPRVRAVSGRPRSRRPDGAAGGTRCAGRARPLGSAAAAVR